MTLHQGLSAQTQRVPHYSEGEKVRCFIFITQKVSEVETISLRAQTQLDGKLLNIAASHVSACQTLNNVWVCPELLKCTNNERLYH